MTPPRRIAHIILTRPRRIGYRFDTAFAALKRAHDFLQCAPNIGVSGCIPMLRPVECFSYQRRVVSLRRIGYRTLGQRSSLLGKTFSVLIALRIGIRQIIGYRRRGRGGDSCTRLPSGPSRLNRSDAVSAVRMCRERYNYTVLRTARSDGFLESIAFARPRCVGDSCRYVCRIGAVRHAT